MPGAGLFALSFLSYALSLSVVAFPGLFADDIITLEAAQENLNILKEFFTDFFSSGALTDFLSGTVSTLPGHS